MMYNPVKLDGIIGDLAQRWEVSADGRRYTFCLHEAQWWDGQAVTAADVQFSLDRMPETGVDFHDPKHIVGSGRFRFKSYQRGHSWELVRTSPRPNGSVRSRFTLVSPS